MGTGLVARISRWVERAPYPCLRSSDQLELRTSERGHFVENVGADFGWCQTNANQSLFAARCQNLCRTKLAPLGESGASVDLEIGA
jgi:hypothetical protein